MDKNNTLFGVVKVILIVTLIALSPLTSSIALTLMWIASVEIGRQAIGKWRMTIITVLTIIGWVLCVLISDNYTENPIIFPLYFVTNILVFGVIRNNKRPRKPEPKIDIWLSSDPPQHYGTIYSDGTRKYDDDNVVDAEVIDIEWKEIK